MRLTILVSLVCAVAAPAKAQQNGKGISGIHTGVSNGRMVGPLTGYGADNFLGNEGLSYRDLRQAQNLISSGNYVQADSLLSGIVGKTSSREARFLKGVAKLGLGDPAAARRYFEQSLYLGRNGHPSAMSGLAIAEIQLGNIDAARNILKKLRYQQDACGGDCDRAQSLDQAVLAIEKALA